MGLCLTSLPFPPYVVTSPAMARLELDPNEWESVLGRMLRYHDNIANDIRGLIAQIRQEMRQELVPQAEERAAFGKVVKRAIRSMWALEYEIIDLQEDFAKQLGSIDLDNLTDDFVEEALLQSKPLQSVLHEIRHRQKVGLDLISLLVKSYPCEETETTSKLCKSVPKRTD